MDVGARARRSTVDRVSPSSSSSTTSSPTPATRAACRGGRHRRACSVDALRSRGADLAHRTPPRQRVQPERAVRRPARHRARSGQPGEYAAQGFGRHRFAGLALLGGTRRGGDGRRARTRCNGLRAANDSCHTAEQRAGARPTNRCGPGVAVARSPTPRSGRPAPRSPADPTPVRVSANDRFADVAAALARTPAPVCRPRSSAHRPRHPNRRRPGRPVARHRAR